MIDNEYLFVKQTDTLKKNRRSSFFTRRISLHTGDINCLADSSEIELNESKGHDEEIKLNDYLNKLKKEREDWKRLLRKTEKENCELKERCSQVVDNSSNWDFLTTEDKKFLEDRPDYVSVGRLLDRARDVVAGRQRLVTVDRRKLSSLACDHALVDVMRRSRRDNNISSSSCDIGDGESYTGYRAMRTMQKTSGMKTVVGGST